MVTRVAAPAGERLGHGGVGVEARAALIEGHHLQVGAEPHPAGIGRQDSGEQVDEGGLAGPVRPDDAEPVAAQDPQGQVRDDGALAEGLRDALRLDHEGAGLLALGHGHADRAEGALALAVLLAHGVQVAEAAHVALAPCRHAVAQPVGLGDELAVELVVLGLLLLQHLDRAMPRNGRSRGPCGG